MKSEAGADGPSADDLEALVLAEAQLVVVTRAEVEERAHRLHCRLGRCQHKPKIKVGRKITGFDYYYFKTGNAIMVCDQRGCCRQAIGRRFSSARPLRQ